MKTRERERIARSLAAYLAWNGACREEGELWGAAEREHAEAPTQWAAGAAAAPALALCRGCPVLDSCGRWAVVDRYTGLAAGQAWIEGEPRPSSWPRNYRYRHGASRVPAAS